MNQHFISIPYKYKNTGARFSYTFQLASVTKLKKMCPNLVYHYVKVVVLLFPHFKYNRRSSLRRERKNTLLLAILQEKLFITIFLPNQLDNSLTSLKKIHFTLLILDFLRMLGGQQNSHQIYFKVLEINFVQQRKMQIIYIII